ncbi:MAG: FAD-dependent oxidoreductase [Kiritimatiellia bacterium]
MDNPDKSLGKGRVLRNRAEEHAFDVVVCGGGLAGLCAAVMAARHSVRVALVQDRPVLGGNSSSEIRVHIHGAGTYWPWMVETGIIAELVNEERLRNPEKVFEGSVNALWDLILYEWALREKNLTLFLNTSVRGVTMLREVPPGGTVPGVLGAVWCSQLGTEKEYMLSAKIFVDATGDGTVAALAGAEWRMGRESRAEFNEPKAPAVADSICQGSTLQFSARNLGFPVHFEAPDWAVRYPSEQALYCRHHDNPNGGYWWIEIGAPFDTLVDNEKIRHELLCHLLGVFDHLKNHGPHGAENIVLDWVGAVPGKRETRRIVGAVMLTENDLRSRRLWPDRIAHGGWFLDEHVPGGLLAADQKPEQSAYDFDVKDLQQVGPYPIPLRALRCRDVANLFMAGRDISVSHVALMSTRVMGTCAVTGQAVGAAAAICIKKNRLPAEMTDEDVQDTQQLLLKADHYIPYVRNCDPDDLARWAEVEADSESELRLPPGNESDWLELVYPSMQIAPLTADRMERVELFLDNMREEPTEISVSLYPKRDIWDFVGIRPDVTRTCPTSEKVGTEKLVRPLKTVTSCVPPGRGWQWFVFDLPIVPGLYAFVVDSAPGVFWSQTRFPQSPPPGTAVATFRRSGCWRFEGLRGKWPAQALRICPPSKPYGPGNVINGVARPEVWPNLNLWMSNPERGLPQSLTLKLRKPAMISEVRFTFDNNLGRNLRGTPGNFVAPELVRDYRVEVGRREETWEPSWKCVVEERNNRRRHRLHRIDPSSADFVRITVLATNGVPEARIYEVRLYAH